MEGADPAEIGNAVKSSHITLPKNEKRQFTSISPVKNNEINKNELSEGVSVDLRPCMNGSEELVNDESNFENDSTTNEAIKPIAIHEETNQIKHNISYCDAIQSTCSSSSSSLMSTPKVLPNDEKMPTKQRDINIQNKSHNEEILHRNEFNKYSSLPSHVRSTTRLTYPLSSDSSYTISK